ncbi:MAG: YraN family protein [Bacteroidaceae bacterium]|nr:YraN family protein [Bacteroidaceae bacterium]
MAKHNILGKEGEEYAADYLDEQGYEILDRNWMCGHKDLDIVAVKDNTLVFVEVKTRSCTDWGDPEDAVTDRKIKSIVRSADAYIRYNCLDMDVRFDIISIIMDDRGYYKVEHIEQAFFPPVE